MWDWCTAGEMIPSVMDRTSSDICRLVFFVTMRVGGIGFSAWFQVQSYIMHLRMYTCPSSPVACVDHATRCVLPVANKQLEASDEPRDCWVTCYIYNVSAIFTIVVVINRTSLQSRHKSSTDLVDLTPGHAILGQCTFFRIMFVGQSVHYRFVKGSEWLDRKPHADLLVVIIAIRTKNVPYSGKSSHWANGRRPEFLNSIVVFCDNWYFTGSATGRSAIIGVVAIVLRSREPVWVEAEFIWCRPPSSIG